MINIADLKDPNDKEGRTYRQINNAKHYKFPVGTLVEWENGVRLFVAKRTRDCDGTPLYNLSPYEDIGMSNSLHVRGVCEDYIKQIKEL